MKTKKSRIYLLIILSLSFIVLIEVLVVKPYKIYFVEAGTGIQHTLTTKVFMGDSLTVKSSWFDDFGEIQVTGLILVTNEERFAIFPYTNINMEFADDISNADAYQDLYDQYNTTKVALEWVQMDDDFSLEYNGTLLIGVSVGTSNDPLRDYGNGIYMVPSYNSNGELIDTTPIIQYSELSGFTTQPEGDKYFITDFIYATIYVNNAGTTIEVLIPRSVVGGLYTEDIGTSEHYTYDYHGHLVPMESENILVQ